ncbi:MAG: hypothetical protein ABIG89_06520 [Candidatus Woesearchaeota archaeon]
MKRLVHTKNLLTDVGGVTFTFDKNARKETWLDTTALIVHSVYREGRDESIQGLIKHPYYEQFKGLEENYIEAFKQYVTGICDELGINPNELDAGDKIAPRVLKDMLIHPTATALLEAIQGRKLHIFPDAWNTQAMPGVKDLLQYIKSQAGVVKGYSTGAPKMPDQFHKAVGLDELVGNVLTTFPGHQAKIRSADQIVEEAVRLYESSVGELGFRRAYGLFIDDNDNEIAIWLDAANTIRKESAGNPVVYLLKKALPVQDTGVTQTEKGRVIVVNSLYQILGAMAMDVDMHSFDRQSSYKVDFAKSDQKFG